MNSDHALERTDESVEHGDVRWQIQRAGQGPTLLLLHGTGGSTHCWADARERLLPHFRVITIDLPGHGGSVMISERERAERFTLPGMARAVGALLHALGERPALAAGHSAGVAILLRLALAGAIAPERIVGFAPALIAPPLWLVGLIAPVAATMVDQAVVATNAARLSRHTTIVERLLDSTGSVLTRAQIATYNALFTNPAHVRATLAMMTRWDVPSLLRDWQAHSHTRPIPVHLIAARGDRWIPLDALQRAVAGIPGVTWQVEEGGHLVPEERVDVVVGALTHARQPTS